MHFSQTWRRLKDYLLQVYRSELSLTGQVIHSRLFPIELKRVIGKPLFLDRQGNPTLQTHEYEKVQLQPKVKEVFLKKLGEAFGDENIKKLVDLEYDVI